MRARPVVMLTPPGGDDPYLLKAVEYFAVEQFVTQAGIEPKAGEANLSI